MAKRQLNRRQNWRIEKIQGERPAPPSANRKLYKFSKVATSARNRPAW